MATDIYLKIPGIKGSSTVDGHKEELEILSYSMGAMVPVGNRSTGGSGAAGTANHQPFSFVKDVDGASTALLQNCWGGTTIKGETILTQQRQGSSDGVKVDYLVYKLNNVVISDFQRGAASGSEATDSFSISYDKIEQIYKVTDSEGSEKGEQSATWDLTTEKK